MVIVLGAEVPIEEPSRFGLTLDALAYKSGSRLFVHKAGCLVVRLASVFYHENDFMHATRMPAVCQQRHRRLSYGMQLTGNPVLLCAVPSEWLLKKQKSKCRSHVQMLSTVTLLGGS
jgi:hypothetical protein